MLWGGERRCIRNQRAFSAEFVMELSGSSQCAGLASPPAKVQINRSAFGGENNINNGKGTNNSSERGRALLQVPFPRRSSPVPQSLPSGKKANAGRKPSTLFSWARGKDPVSARRLGRERRGAAPPPVEQRPRLQPDGAAGAGVRERSGDCGLAPGPTGGCGREERGGPEDAALLLSPGPPPRRAALGVGS